MGRIRTQHDGYIAGPLPTIPDLEAWWARRLADLGLTERPGGTVHAYVNDSRWVGDCPECAAGVLCTPGVPVTVCLECGRRHQVVTPPDWEVIDAALARRPKAKHRNWHVDEPVDRLLAENQEHLP